VYNLFNLYDRLVFVSLKHLSNPRTASELILLCTVSIMVIADRGAKKLVLPVMVTTIFYEVYGMVRLFGAGPLSR
jgi:hypothetical protein